MSYSGFTGLTVRPEPKVTQLVVYLQLLVVVQKIDVPGPLLSSILFGDTMVPNIE